MRDACAVIGRSGESDAENIVGIIAGNMKMLSPCLVMLQANGVQLQLLDMTSL